MSDVGLDKDEGSRISQRKRDAAMQDRCSCSTCVKVISVTAQWA